MPHAHLVVPAAQPALISPNTDPEATPVTPWNDSPRTMYKTSPGTEVGDADLEDGDSDHEDRTQLPEWFEFDDQVSTLLSISP